MTTEERRRRRFSESFRREQVGLIEKGELSIPEVCRLYEVSYTAVRRWVQKFGSVPLAPRLLVQSSRDVDRLRDLEKENKKLKMIIGEQQVELLYKTALLGKAKLQLGEDFEKK